MNNQPNNDDESAARKRAIDFARGSVRLEGFVVSPEAESIGQRYVAGELSLDEFIDQVRACTSRRTGSE